MLITYAMYYELKTKLAVYAHYLRY